jgi:hypothetical protein
MPLVSITNRTGDTIPINSFFGYLTAFASRAVLLTMDQLEHTRPTLQGLENAGVISWHSNTNTAADDSTEYMNRAEVEEAISDGGGGGGGGVVVWQVPSTSTPSDNIIAIRDELVPLIIAEEVIGATVFATQGEGGEVSGDHVGALSGQMLFIETNHSVIAGGLINSILTGSDIEPSGRSAIVGGESNTIVGDYAFIGGGESNSIGYAGVHGDYSVITGGNQNSIKAKEFSIIANGTGNTIEQNFGIIIGGDGNTLYEPDEGSLHSVIGGGEANSIAGGYSVVGGGIYNHIGSEESSNYDVIAGGENNEIFGDYNAIIGGAQNRIETNYGVILGGAQNELASSATYGQASGLHARSLSFGQRSVASGVFVGSNLGHQQFSDMVLRGETPGASSSEVVELKAGGNFSAPNSSFLMENNKTYMVGIEAVARKTNGTSKSWTKKCLVSYVGTTPTVSAASNVITPLEVGSPAAGWDITVSANTVGIHVSFTTGTGNTEAVRVVAHVSFVECVV